METGGTRLAFNVEAGEGFISETHRYGTITRSRAPCHSFVFGSVVIPPEIFIMTTDGVFLVVWKSDS